MSGGPGGKQIASAQEFRALGSSYGKKSLELESLKKFLEGQIKSAMWQGNAATNFRSEWDTHKANMEKLKLRLDELSRELKARAPIAEQLNTRR
jgi:WXG100 family type VII secretion target